MRKTPIERVFFEIEFRICFKKIIFFEYEIKTFALTNITKILFIKAESVKLNSFYEVAGGNTLSIDKLGTLDLLFVLEINGPLKKNETEFDPIILRSFSFWKIF
ncbi:hypothetical protein LEP1GSC193_2264 [Leptospira alstonii serovar Pingchang str. 80-412]|uniref:Uncharacterized protein n=2 Tax=Leptospira alstonii TaxID=28452 RepID=M6D0F3_9LEPT|nr:hypothetical protein LEP1GSC194_0331 [Leptospira alstonii serovar Sichuan str. 79601]EQA79944.1 hypothetical protein LEP1GSC193_2264 [Leptospira alstonii serovar Pingchang str. 80-412]